MHVRFDELQGRTVLDANGRVLGRVKAALVDMETWVVDTLRINVSRHAAADMEMEWSFWRSWFRPPTIDISTGQINAAGDAVILRLSFADLREMPRHSVDALAAVH